MITLFLIDHGVPIPVKVRPIQRSVLKSQSMFSEFSTCDFLGEAPSKGQVEEVGHRSFVVCDLTGTKCVKTGRPS